MRTLNRWGDPVRRFIKAGNRVLEAEVIAQSFTWKEDGTVRIVDRSIGAVLHRPQTSPMFKYDSAVHRKKKFEHPTTEV